MLAHTGLTRAGRPRGHRHLPLLSKAPSLVSEVAHPPATQSASGAPSVSLPGTVTPSGTSRICTCSVRSALEGAMSSDRVRMPSIHRLRHLSRPGACHPSHLSRLQRHTQVSPP